MSYEDDFRKHQISVQAHLIGLQENNPLPPSLFFPASYWTSSEKNLFFHGLILYSRLRPDLIAEHIKTKSTFDVCSYLRTLQVATTLRGYEPEAPARETMEPAADMSERWVEREEEMAAALIVDCCCWSVEHSEKKSLGNCSCASSTFDIAAEPSSPSSQQEQQAYTNHLDSACLSVLDSIIRESQIKYVDLENAIPLEQGPGISPSTQTRVEEEIQPSPLTDLQSAPLETTVSKTTSPFLHLELQESPSNVHEGIVRPTFTDNSYLRRLKKQLYMRRRRAEQVGQPLVPLSIKLLPGRKKRPRKPSKPRPKTYRSSHLRGGSINQQSESEGSQPPNDNDQSLFELRSNGGLTKPYRVKKLFLETGIDGQALSEMRLDIFHLATLARLMRPLNSLNGATTSLETVSLSAETISLLVSITEDFVSEIIRRAVIRKELEVRLKREIKVWRYDRNEVTAENVTECLVSMGLGQFAEIVGHVHEDTVPVLSDPSSPGVVNGGQVPNFCVDGDILEQGFLPPHSFTLPRSIIWRSLPSHRDLFSSDDICDLDFGDGDLDWVMQEEEQLDMEDSLKSQEYEGSLWAQSRASSSTFIST